MTGSHRTQGFRGSHGIWQAPEARGSRFPLSAQWGPKPAIGPEERYS
jgi:hypothetical protein